MFFQANAKAALRRSWRMLPPAVRSVALKAFAGGITDEEKFVVGLPTLLGMLHNVRAAGFAPRTIVDVGANVGNWTRTAATVFPAAHYFMFDANPDNEVHLQRSQATVGATAEYAITLLGPREREAVTFYKIGSGSSVLPELTSFERTPVTLPMCTLDDFMARRTHAAPMLLKLDVQGFELEVLRGARTLLERAEFVLLEVSLLPYNEGSPLMGDVIEFMAEHDFVTFDFCGQARRETDRALYQVDVAFVKSDSALRAPRKFWLREP